MGFYQALNTADNCLIAIRAGGRGNVTKSHVLWRYRKALPNTSSPLLYQGVIYLVRDGVMTSLNPDNGQIFKQGRLTGALCPLLVFARRRRWKTLHRERRWKSCRDAGRAGLRYSRHQ